MLSITKLTELIQNFPFLSLLCTESRLEYVIVAEQNKHNRMKLIELN